MSGDPDVSEDGRFIAFSSLASNLVANDVGAYADVFVRDLAASTTQRISVSSAGAEANNDSYSPVISADGRYVAFNSYASNLVQGDTGGYYDVFLHDRQTGTTSRVSVDTGGGSPDNESYVGGISGNGRYVVFESVADDIVPGDTNGFSDIFLRDTVAATTTRVSVDSAGNEADNFSSDPSISDDGRYIVFRSRATNLVTGDTNSAFDIFLHDRITSTTTRVSTDSAGAQANNSSSTPAISGDGRYIAFASQATNLATSDANGVQADIFVKDRISGTTSLVSVSSDGTQASSSSGQPALSGDGRYVSFVSFAPNLVALDTNGDIDVFVHDRVAGKTHRASVDFEGGQANGSSGLATILGTGRPSLTNDGRLIAFDSAASNLVSTDANGFTDVFFRAIPEVAVTSVLPSVLSIGATTPVTITGENFLPGASPATNATVSNVVIVDESTITADITVPLGRAPGAYNLTVLLNGTGAGALNGSAALCSNCLTFQ